MMPRRLFPSAHRRDIATDDPVAREMWREGASLREITKHLGYSSKSGSLLGVSDPGPRDPVPAYVPPDA